MIAPKNLSPTFAIMFLGVGITYAIDTIIIVFKFHRDWGLYSSNILLATSAMTIVLFSIDFDDFIEKRFGESRFYKNNVWYIFMTCVVLAFIAMNVKWYVRHGNQFSL